MIPQLYIRISNYLKNTAFCFVIQGLCPLYTQLNGSYKGVEALPWGPRISLWP